jgi:hypothetical protein
MKDSDVAFFSELLNLEADVVKGAFEEGTLGTRVKDAVMAKSDVETLKKNLANEVKSAYLDELAEGAKKGEVPQALYKPIHGAVFEKLEKTLSRKHDIADFDNVEDLVEKAISKNKGQSNDTKELDDLIAELKEANKKLVKEKEEAEKRITHDYESKILKRDLNDYINNVPFDFSDVEEADMDKVSSIRKRTLTSVFETTYTPELIDGKIIVKDKDGDVLKNEATREPIPVSDVLSSLAKEVGLKLISPESGGQGGKSSGSKSSLFKSVDDYISYCEDKGIQPTSAEGLKLLKESGLKLY